MMIDRCPLVQYRRYAFRKVYQVLIRTALVSQSVQIDQYLYVVADNG